MDLVESNSCVRARHPWEEARARFFLRVLAGARIPAPGQAVMDVGAGDAWFARELSGRFLGLADIACWDSGYGDEKLAKAAFGGSHPLRFCRERPRGTFALLILQDVLEHVEDDAAFLGSLVAESLAPGGFALVSVPAWPTLLGAHDVHLRHHRRYYPGEARRLLAGAGLEISLAGGLFASLLLVRAVQKGLEKIVRPGIRLSHAGEWTASLRVTNIVRAVLSCDAWACLAGARIGLRLPGLSWWALCRKPSR